MLNQLEERIHIGPAGWDYPDWDGVFYPPRSRRFDALAFVASYFTLVEINSTFYRVPPPHLTRRWAERVASRPHFMFTLKAHRSLTHEGRNTAPTELPALRNAIDPLVDANRLGAVLLQFPWSFRFDEDARRVLSARVRDLHPYPLAVEVRHASWEQPDAAQFLASLDVTVCGIDQPVIGESIPPYHYRAGPAGTYFRLHGRNYRNWFAAGAGRDARYDYLYSPEELSPWAGVIRSAAETTAAYVVLNNHFRGQAPANAFELAFQLFGRKLPAPERLRQAIPRLADSTVARTGTESAPGLFDG
ncbi:MAG TPA: DUF72 domain-containing protein [Candidatus Krumholzibacteria bacterium]|nr:DUF72 domain-containing protein [Candidatus Krumholzibacteria bacterium]